MVGIVDRNRLETVDTREVQTMITLHRSPSSCVAVVALWTAPALAATQVIRLEPGWNLVSLSVDPTPANLDPTPTSQMTVLESVRNKVAEVWTYDANTAPPAWLGYKPPAIASLNELHGGRGYLIRFTGAQAADVTMNGSPVEGGIFLTTGGNLVAPYAPVPIPAADAYPSLQSAHGRLWTLDASTGKWATYATGDPMFLPKIVTVGPDRGYWVLVGQQLLWNGPVLSVDVPSAIVFGRGSDQFLVQVSNAGAPTLSWTATVPPSKAWVQASPPGGSTTTQTDAIVVRVNWDQVDFPVGALDPPTDPCTVASSQRRSGVAATQTAETTLAVSSNGGSVGVPIQLFASTVDGHYEGFAQPRTVNEKPIDLPKVALAMDIVGGGSSAVITAEGTPFFPVDVFLTGIHAGRAYDLTGQFVVPKADSDGMNMFGADLLRSVTLHGVRLTNDRISGGSDGDYLETIEFPGAEPIVVRGSFEVTRAFRRDADQDGIPDDWEIRYALNPKDPADACNDPDNDGRTNWREFMDRTDPRVNDAAPGPVKITGTVVEKNGGPMEHVLASLNFGAEVLTAETDASGRFSFPDLVPGYYLVSINPFPGFTFSPESCGCTVQRGTKELTIIGHRGTTDAVVDFVGSPLTGNAPMTVQFVALQSTIGDQPAGAFQWLFGDVGFEANRRDPRHSYATPGEYAVTLVTDLPGGSVTKFAYVHVEPGRSSSFRLLRSVYAIMGGLESAIDNSPNQAQTRIRAVVGTVIVDAAQPSESTNYRLSVADIP